MTISKPVYYFGLTLSFLIALLSYRFIFGDMKLFYPDLIDHIDHRKLTFIAHISAAPTALISGLVNLIERKNKNHPVMHRWSGRIYATSILIGGLSGLNLALNAAGGMIPAIGFSILSILWIVFTAQAIRFAIQKNVAQHRKWIIRSFALTFAAVTLRLYLLGFTFIADMTYAQASVWIAWLCWVPNVVFAEWWIRRDKSKVKTKSF